MIFVFLPNAVFLHYQRLYLHSILGVVEWERAGAFLDGADNGRGGKGCGLRRAVEGVMDYLKASGWVDESGSE